MVTHPEKTPDGGTEEMVTYPEKKLDEGTEEVEFRIVDQTLRVSKTLRVWRSG